MAIKINGVTVIDDSRNGNLAAATATGNISGGNITTGGLISATGNITGSYIFGNGSQLTGIDATSIQNGTSSMTVIASGGNIRANIGGATVETIASDGVRVTGIVSATGNVTGGGITLSGNSIISTGATLTIDPSTSGIEGNVVIAGNLSVQGNVTYIDSTTITTNEKDIVLANNVNTQSAVNGAGILLGNNSVVTWTYNNTANAWTANVGVSATGNITGGNLSGTNVTGTLTTAAQTNITSVGTLSSLSVTGNIDGGNLRTAGVVSATGNITGGNISATNHTGTTVSVTGNIDGGNLRTAGVVSATGAITGAAITGSSLTVSTGNVSCGNINNNNANGVGNIGNSTTYFNTVFAKATSAQYADLAEMYQADQIINSGTVVCFGGDAEVTVCDVDASRRVAGVVSTNPSYIMNAGLQGDNVVAVALTGRVPTKVTGTIRKGDMLVSAGSGRARAEANPATGAVIGKALADFDGVEGVIEVVVGRL